MSSIKERADLEALIAEAELDDAERERVTQLIDEGATVPDAVETIVAERTTKEAEDEAEPAAATEEGEPTPAQLKRLEKEIVDHLDNVREIMAGHVAGFVACDTCGGVGLTPPNPEPRTHANFKACPTCLGWGQVRTGSLAEGHAVRSCPSCAGRGYLEALDAAGNPLSPAAGEQPGASPALAPVADEAAASNGDAAPAEPTFGVPTWMGDPSIGR